MTGIFFLFTIGLGERWIVNVTPTLNSWKSPEFRTLTWKARSVDAVISFALALAPGTRRLPSGSAVTDTSALPCDPVGVPPVAAPWMRLQMSVIAAVLARSGFGTMFESGTPPMSLTPCCWSSRAVGSRK